MRKKVVCNGKEGDRFMEDHEIIQQFWDRNEGAVREASRKFGNYCRSIAKSILNNHEDSEECVNEALMRAWESIPPQKPQSLCAFLGRITKNIALNRIKLSNSQKRGGGEVALVYEELEEIISDTKSVEDTMERKEMMSSISRFLRKSKDKDRQVFILRYWYCCSIPEIAQEVGLKEENVYVILSRTRTKLRDHLKKEGYDV